MAGPAETTLNQPADLLPTPVRSVAEPPPVWPDRKLESRSLVDISPPEIVRRDSAAWSGLHAETVQITRHAPFEYGFRAPCHLLIATEIAERYDGETFVEGLPRSPCAISRTSSPLFLRA
jgi:AraC family transcriptional regulator